MCKRALKLRMEDIKNIARASGFQSYVGKILDDRGLQCYHVTAGGGVWAETGVK